jgi:hypothetical protein
MSSLKLIRGTEPDGSGRYYEGGDDAVAK